MLSHSVKADCPRITVDHLWGFPSATFHEDAFGGVGNGGG